MQKVVDGDSCVSIIAVFPLLSVDREEKRESGVDL